MKVKDDLPFDVGLFETEYRRTVEQLTSPNDLTMIPVSNVYANTYVYHHHYLHRRIYIARNVSYGIWAAAFCVGVAMFGYPVWREYPGLVPPLRVEQCPELIRLCTMSGLPRNTESWFIGKCIRAMQKDWKAETGVIPLVITSFCDLALGFDGAIYKATNFELLRITDGRSSNPGGPHGKWAQNTHQQNAEKAFYVYRYDRKPVRAQRERQAVQGRVR